MKTNKKIFAIPVIFMMAGMYSCSNIENDYIQSLNVEHEYVFAVDSISLETYNVYAPNKIVRINENLVLVSLWKGEHHLLLLNLDDNEYTSSFYIKRGRGPFEIAQGGSLHPCGNNAVYYDVTTSTAIIVDVMESISMQKPILDTLCCFSDKFPKPIFLRSFDDGFISCNMADDAYWYSLYDKKGNLVSNVDAMQYDILKQSRDCRISVMASSLYCIDPTSTKVCVANVVSPSISFAYIADSALHEFKRYEISPPTIKSGGNGLSHDNISAFQDIACDPDYVYLLYSGHMLQNDTLPSSECKHLIQYSWEGKPIKHFELDKNICSICIYDNELLGCSEYPEAKIFKFIL